MAQVFIYQGRVIYIGDNEGLSGFDHLFKNGHAIEIISVGDTGQPLSRSVLYDLYPAVGNFTIVTAVALEVIHYHAGRCCLDIIRIAQMLQRISKPEQETLPLIMFLQGGFCSDLIADVRIDNGNPVALAAAKA